MNSRNSATANHTTNTSQDPSDDVAQSALFKAMQLSLEGRNQTPPQNRHLDRRKMKYYAGKIAQRRRRAKWRVPT